MKQSQITYWCHEIIRSQARKGGVYIDATMGKGNDTLMLCELAGNTGEVYGFDIQAQAVDATRTLLEKHEITTNYHLILDGHENMDSYIQPSSADVICFNFGYLPGGDHKIATKSSTSIIAIQKGLELLKSGGMMSLCVYSGGDTGFEEKDSILRCLRELPTKEYTVIVNQYFNRGNNPPIPIFVFKN